MDRTRSRRGSIFVLSACLLIVVFAFAAFAIDLGYITASQAELQKTSDSAALAATIELSDGWGPGALRTPEQIETAARSAVSAIAGANRAAGRNSVYTDVNRDVRFGQYQWDGDAGTWTKVWGEQPYSLVEVTLRRDQEGSTNGDRPLDLFFAPVIGTKQANILAKSTTALIPGKGIRIRPGSGRTAGVLPIALDVQTWDNFMDGIGGSDSYRYNESNRTVSTGGDGIREINIYPFGSQNLPPGNRGTVDFGSSNNSTADIARQIRYGLNENDLSYFPDGQLIPPMVVNGDTGISAGIKDDLDAIKGQPRLMPLFSTVSGPGNNAMYTIVRFVGVRIMYVNLTGKPTSKVVMVQPCPYVADTVIPTTGTIEEDSYFTPTGLIP